MRENSHEGGDFRFCYVGPPGTFTPLHRDVYASYSWSANVVGRKHWWLFPPDKVEGLKKNGELVFDVRELPDEGNGIKVIQEVSPLSLSDECQLTRICATRKGRSSLSRADGIIKS